MARHVTNSGRQIIRQLLRAVATPVARKFYLYFFSGSKYYDALTMISPSIASRDQSVMELQQQIAVINRKIKHIESLLAFDRQAVHDLGWSLFSGRETVLAHGRHDISVIVTTCDRKVELERALFSLTRQTRRPDSVILVNDGREKVQEIVNRFSGQLNISVLNTTMPYSGPSVARNMALDSLNTTFVAFLDDDNLMWPRWIEHALSFFEADLQLDLVYGSQLRDSEFSTTDKTWFLVPFDFDELQKANFIDLNQIVHRSSSVRFDENLRRLVDWDYVLKLAERSPERIRAVNAISSIYSTSAWNRISVPYWPPDLNEFVAHRRRGGTMSLQARHRACSCCGYIGNFDAGPDGRERAACHHCSALERHRFLLLMAPLLQRFWIPETRQQAEAVVLEIAPSLATLPFRLMFGTALTIDADPAADGRAVNIVASLTGLPVADDAIDIAVALHVLEHIPDDHQAMAEIARVLRPNGLAVLQVPLSGRPTTDEEVLGSAEERIARYGQADHIRSYGDDFFSRLEHEGLKWISLSPCQTMPPETAEKYGLRPDEALVFVVRVDSPFAVARLEAFEAALRQGGTVATLLPDKAAVTRCI